MRRGFAVAVLIAIGGLLGPEDIFAQGIDSLRPGDRIRITHAAASTQLTIGRPARGMSAFFRIPSRWYRGSSDEKVPPAVTIASITLLPISCQIDIGWLATRPRCDAFLG